MEIFPEMAHGRTKQHQAIMQLVALIVTLAFAVVGGLVTGRKLQN